MTPPVAVKTIAPENWKAPHHNEADIHAAALKLHNEGRGGRIILPVGRDGESWAKIDKSEPLPMYPGILYENHAPALVPRAGFAIPGAFEDGFDWKGSGTVFQGDGTFPFLEANATDLSVPDDEDTPVSGLSQVGLRGLGIDGFTDGISIGAANVMGLEHSVLDEIYVRNCSGWGLSLINAMFTRIGKVFIDSPIDGTTGKGGARFGANMPNSMMSPGNYDVGNLTVFLGHSGNARKRKGIEFFADNIADANPTTFAAPLVHRLQVNSFRFQALLSVTATFTNGSANVTVPDGSLYEPGFLVFATADGLGLNKGLAYYVKTVVGNTITLGNHRTAADILATGNGTLTLQSYGFPHVIVGGRKANTKVHNLRIGEVDVEGHASAQMYIEHAANGHFNCDTYTSESLVAFVMRDVSDSHFKFNGQSYDADSASAGCIVMGDHDDPRQMRLKGIGHGGTYGAHQTTAPRDGRTYPRPDLYDTGAMLGRGIAVAEMLVRGVNGTTMLNKGHCGIVPFRGAADATWGLPQIDDASAMPLANDGLYYEAYNWGTNAAKLTFVCGGLPWTALTAYGVGAQVVLANKVYVATAAGTSASSGGPTGTGSSITDGTVTWTYLDAQQTIDGLSYNLVIPPKGGVRLVADAVNRRWTGRYFTQIQDWATITSFASGAGSSGVFPSYRVKGEGGVEMRGSWTAPIAGLAIGTALFTMPQEAWPTAVRRILLSRATAATLEPGTGNSKIKFTSKLVGPLGNAITVRLVDPAANNQALSVTVGAPPNIVVNLATGAGGAITSTVAQVIVAVLANGTAAALVAVGNGTGSDGTGVMAAAAVTSLAGGTEHTGKGAYVNTNGTVTFESALGAGEFVSLDGHGYPL